MNKRVLIVEDDPSTLLLLKRMLERIDPHMAVTCVKAAEEAYWALNSAQQIDRQFDFVVADLFLPHSDGLLLWERVKKKYPGIDFLFISGTSYEDWAKRVEGFGQWPPFIRKPITEENLRRFWNEYFSSSGEATG